MIPRFRRVVAAAACTLALCVGHAGARSTAQVPVPRDSGTAPAIGRAGISGLVATPEGAPVVRATVTLTDAKGQIAQSTLTDANGVFNLIQLPAGRYELAAAMPSFLTAYYGQTRPGRPGTPLTLADGQVMRSVRLQMVRGGVISGTVLDAAGQPAWGSSVRLLHRVYGPAGPALAPVENAQMPVDDRGQYRLHSLPPGDYVVAVVPRNEPSAPDDKDRLVATYFPNVLSADQATPVSLGPAEERAGVDVRLQFTSVFSVRGQVAGGAGPAFVWLDSANAEPMPMFYVRGRPVDADGRFVIRGVLPGVYRLMASDVPAYSDAVPQAGRKWSVREVIVGAQDVADLTLILTPGTTVAGRVVYAGRAGAPQGNAGVSLILNPISRTTGLPDSERLSSKTDSAGRFRMAGIPPGRYVVFVGGAPSGWWPRSAVVDGRDVLDVMLDVSTDIPDLVLTMADAPPEISGRLTDLGERAVSQFTVIAFAADPQFWGPGSRRIREAGWDADGGYHISALPAGPYLLAVLQDAEKYIWYDPRFLETLRGRAQPVTLVDGQRLVQDLRIKQP